MDTVTSNCLVCGLEIDVLPDAGGPSCCDDCMGPKALTLSLDGTDWCVLEGMSLQEGIAGFGKTPELAFSAYLAALAADLAKPVAGSGHRTGCRGYDCGC